MSTACVNHLQAGGSPAGLARFTEALHTPQGAREVALLANLYPCPARLAGSDAALGWAQSHWGTPWGDVATRSQHAPGATVAHVRFLTAGQPALRGMQEVSRRTPHLAFIYSAWQPARGMASCAALLEGTVVAQLTEWCTPCRADHSLEMDTRDDVLACSDWHTQRALARLEDAAISMLPLRARLAFMLPPRPGKAAAA